MTRSPDAEGASEKADDRTARCESQVTAFVADLKRLRADAGQPSLRTMAVTAHYSHTALSSVVSGGRLPSLELTLAFVRACGGDEDAWRTRWQQVRPHVTRAATAPPLTTAPVPVAPPHSLRKRHLVIVASVLAITAITAISVTVVALSQFTPRPHTPPAVNTQTTPPAPARSASAALVPGDDVAFVADLTIPDGTTVRVNERFIKTWEIQNVGSIPWHNRYLQRLGPATGQGLCTSPTRVSVPATNPGQKAEISVAFAAPDLPGSCRVDWKMVDSDGQPFFPNRQGLYVIVNVVR